MRTALSLIVLEQRGIARPLDLAGRTFLAVARQNIKVLLISQSSSDGNICFVIPREDTQSLVSALDGDLKSDPARREQICLRVVEDVMLLTAANHAQSALTSAATMCRALAEQAVNILVVTQGAASISLVIEASNAARAIDAINRLS